MFAYIIFTLLNFARAEISSDDLSILISPESDKVLNIIVTCDSKRQKKAVSKGRVVFTDISAETCNLKFNPGGGSFRNVSVGSELECLVSDGMRVHCTPLKKNVQNKATEATKKKLKIEKKAPITRAKDSLVASDQLSIEISATSDVVLSINATCGNYRKKGMVKEGKVVFSDIPSETCNLKFNPGGGAMRNIAVGSALRCSIVNGNRVSCK